MRATRAKSLIAAYAKHLAIAWPGVAVAGFASAAILQFRAWGALFDFPSSAPFFSGYVLLGAAAGYFCAQRDGSRAALWVWVPALLLFLEDIRFWVRMPVGGGWHGVWIDYFSQHCGGSECLNELLMTAPLYATIAYALAAWLALRRLAARDRAAARALQP